MKTPGCKVSWRLSDSLISAVAVPAALVTLVLVTSPAWGLLLLLSYWISSTWNISVWIIFVPLLVGVLVGFSFLQRGADRKYARALDDLKGRPDLIVREVEVGRSIMSLDALRTVQEFLEAYQYHVFFASFDDWIERDGLTGKAHQLEDEFWLTDKESFGNIGEIWEDLEHQYVELVIHLSDTRSFDARAFHENSRPGQFNLPASYFKVGRAMHIARQTDDIISIILNYILWPLLIARKDTAFPVEEFVALLRNYDSDEIT